MCVFDVWSQGVVFQYSELPQLWLLPPGVPVSLYPWRLQQYYPTVTMGVPTKPDIRWPTVSETAKKISACSKPTHPAPPGPRWHWEADLSEVVVVTLPIVTKACLAKTRFKGEQGTFAVWETVNVPLQRHEGLQNTDILCHP